MLKPLNRGIGWMNRVCQVTWRSGKTPNVWQTVVIIFIHKKMERMKYTNYRDTSLISITRNVYAKCLEKRMM